MIKSKIQKELDERSNFFLQNIDMINFLFIWVLQKRFLKDNYKWTIQIMGSHYIR